MRRRGSSASSPSFRRSHDTCMSSVFVEPNQFSSQTSDIARSRVAGEIVRYQSYTPGADAEGDIDALSLWAGQSVGIVSQVKTAGEIVQEIAEEAQRTLRGLMQ